MASQSTKREIAALCAKDTLGQDRYKYLVQTIERLNVEMKRMGRPKDEDDRFMLRFMKDDIARCKRELDWAGTTPCSRGE